MYITIQHFGVITIQEKEQFLVILEPRFGTVFS